MATEDLIAEALEPSRSFNWLFLVTLLVCGTLAIFFLFYFNRLFATLVSYGIRAYSWHALHAYVDIQALQISLLGGRIFFKGLRYHAHNETILIHGGYITWQYWLRKVKDTQIFNEELPLEEKDSEKESSPGSSGWQSQSRKRNTSIGREEKGGKKSEKQLPCRVDIKVSGVEAFLYNRSPAYDFIVDSIAKCQQAHNGVGYATSEEASSRGSLDEKSNGTTGNSAIPDHKANGKQFSPKAHTGIKLQRESTKQNSHRPPRVRTVDHPSQEPPAFLRLLPICVRCKKGAIVLGNENTKCVTTAKFENAFGELDAGHSGALDIFKLLVNFEVEHPVVQLHPNHDFKGTQLALAGRRRQGMNFDKHDNPTKSHGSHGLKPKHSRHFFSRWQPHFRRSVDSVATASQSPRRNSFVAEPAMELPGQSRWQGLTRYLEEYENNEHDEWDPIEYARAPTLADLPRVKLTFYWDIPGPVPAPNNLQDSSYMTDTSDINGSVPPEYGLDIAVFGGVVNYGPWTDRQRINIQSVFFPPICTDAVPAERIRPGQERYSTVFKVFVSVEEEVVLRIPVRESSKDWKWHGHAEAYKEQVKRNSDKQTGRGPGKRRRGKKQDRGLPPSNLRPFGWFDIKVEADTTINYTMDMVAGQDGYHNAVDVDVTKLEITTSVNHDLLWQSGRQLVTCDLSNPLQWNRVREWTFNIGSHETEIFLLTDHLILLLDLINDWGAGPQPDFYTFLPMRYLLHIDFHNFKLYINTNDSNIINNPSDLDDNNFIILYGKLLSGKVTIPMDRFRPVQNSVLFDGIGHDFGLELCPPSKSTIHTFMPDRQVARLGDLNVDGSHNFFSETDPSLTDRLIMNIHGEHFSLDAYGFLLRQFVNFKENYFGEDLHFKTLEEFQSMPERTPSRASTVAIPEHSEKSNALDVILCISAEDTSIQLPANLYDKKDNVRLELKTASLDLRFTNYYMDMMLDTSPLGIALGTLVKDAGTPDDSSSGTQIFLDGVHMYGHRLFGLPPAEPAYMGDWNLDVGAITGECNSVFLRILAKAGRAIAFTLPDDENAMPISHPTTVHDVTFLKVRTKMLRLWLHIGQEALLVSTGAMNVDFNDWAGQLFSQRLGVLVPDVCVACLDARSALRHRTRQGEKTTVETYALIETNLQLHLVKQNVLFSQEREKQQNHVVLHDQKTQRTNFLLEGGRRHGDVTVMPMGVGIDPPAMPFPPVPLPISKHADQGRNSTISDNSSIKGSVRSMRSIESSPHPSVHGDNCGRRRSHSRPADQPSTNLDQPYSQSLLAPSSDPGARVPLSLPRSQSLYGLPTEHEREMRGLGPSTVTFSSPFACPYFPLDACEPDTKDAPGLPDYLGGDYNEAGEINFTDATAEGIDESSEHTSLIIKAEPGISVLCKPQAIDCVANVIDTVFSKTPEDLLDDFQFSVITEILGIKKRKHGTGSNLDFTIRIPFVHFRFLATSPALFAGANRECRDQYDIVLDKTALLVRSKVPPAQVTEKESTSVHVTVRSLAVSAAEILPGKMSNKVAVRVNLEEVLLWVASKNNVSINVSFKDCAAAVVGKKVEYLASLVQRNVLAVETYEGRFKKLMSDHQDRLRYLAHELTISGGDIADPPFLTRATYVLRAADDHLRIHDSWKILSRFRYIYHCLPAAHKREITINCLNRKVVCPIEAESSVIRSWEGWRSWDLAHIKESVAIRFLYGAVEDVPELHKHDPLPLSAVVRSGTLRLLVDPGPRQNEVAFENLALGLSMTPPQTPSGLMLIDNVAPTVSITVQINSAKTDIKISWEILELLEALLDLFKGSLNHNSNDEKVHETMGAQRRSSISAPDQRLQIVFATDHGNVSLDTINLAHSARSKGLRVSIVAQIPGSKDKEQSISALAHAEAAASEMFGHKRLLWRTRIEAPTISVAHNRARQDSNQPEDLKIVGATKHVVVDIKEEILGLMEVMDSVIGDELDYVYQQVMKHRDELQGNRSVPSNRPEKPPRIHVALFMDKYKFDAALLRSLNYSMLGDLSSLAITPDATKPFALDIDYNLGAQLHEIINITPAQPHVIAALGFPSVNGRVKFSRQGKENMIAVQSTIESINLEAAAINALVIALSRSEITNVFKTMKHDGLGLKDHIESIIGSFGDVITQKKHDEDRDKFVYDIRATLVGFSIRAKAPATSESESIASITMSLEGAQVTATNRLEREISTPQLPEIRARLGQINLILQTSDNGLVKPCGNVTFGLIVHCTSQQRGGEEHERQFIARSSGLEVNVYAETASVVVDVINHLQDKIKDLDLSKEVTYLRKLRYARKQSLASQTGQVDGSGGGLADTAAALLASSFSLELRDIQISWVVDTSIELYEGQAVEDLVLSFDRIDLSTRKTDEARLLIECMQLQMVPHSHNKKQRSLNSALFPELVFNVAYESSQSDRRLTFHAAGKRIDLLLQSYFILPASVLERSISSAIAKSRKAITMWEMTPTTSGAQRKNVFGDKRLSSLIVDADFAGAVVHLERSNDRGKTENSFSPLSSDRIPQQGKFGQFVDSHNEPVTELHTPGIALKLEYQDRHGIEPSLKAELMVNASKNVLYPTSVPIVMEISKGIKEVVRDTDGNASNAVSKAPQKFIDEELIGADPSALLGKTRLNLGLRICKQEFSLTCHPYARVAASGKFEDIYLTLNTIKSTEQGNFFAISAAFTRLEAKVRHVYSRDDTFRVSVESIVLSLMNSKHLSGESGISAILKIAPARTMLNVKQLQDFLLFREIWIPPEVRSQAGATPASPEPAIASQEYLVQKYHKVASVAAFPWNASIAIAELALELDLGQAIGKSAFIIKNLWIHSKKNSNWEQNLCAGIGNMGVDCTGRMSGYVDLQGLRLRTSIAWPGDSDGFQQTPLIQASIGFEHLRVKAAFDYQAFAIADISKFDFLMYNVRERDKAAGDRLVAILDGDKVQVFCTATSAAQALALVQAFDRLVQEKQAAFTQSLKEIEASLKRQSAIIPSRSSPLHQHNTSIPWKKDDNSTDTPIKLHTDVMVTLKSINVGAFPSTFFDNQIFKLEAEETSARFAVTLEGDKIHSGLGMTLGQLRVALSAVRNTTLPKPLGEVTVEEIVSNATGSRGGTILKVPKVVATMQTWQVPSSNHIDYIFKSSFEGKVDVGWNYSRISFIRTMWSNHSRTLASRLGKPLPESAVKITAGPSSAAAVTAETPDASLNRAGESTLGEGKSAAVPETAQEKREQEKITAVVNVPQSRYDYAALEPPIIETPQLRDMGEATPPLEWIGLHRDRLPNITHQIVIVTLLEVAKEVEDAYERILGSNLGG